MDLEVWVVIFECLWEKVYVIGSMFLWKGFFIKWMYFIVCGSLFCVGYNGFMINIGVGKFCGEEFLFWYFE